MAIPTITITGAVLTGDGEPLKSGTIVAEPSQPFSILDGATSQRVIVGKVVGTITAGAISSDFKLAPNDAGTPSGTYWKVTISGRTHDDHPYYSRTPERWQLASSPASIDIGAVPRLDVVPGVALGLPAATTTAPGAVQLAEDLGGTSAAPTVVATHLASPLPEAQGGTGVANFSTLMAGKVTAAGGDASAVVVTPTGGSTARTAAAYMADLRVTGLRVALSDSIRRTDLSQARAEPADAPLSTPVPYVGTALIHPDVVFFPGRWNGYRYWMAVTPFEGGDIQYENPSVYVSQDGKSWSTPPGGSNPVVPYPGAGVGYNADPELVDGLDGRLYLFYKFTGGGQTITRARYTTDGATWSADTDLFSQPSASENASPAVVFDGHEWSMFTVSTDTYSLQRRTAPFLLGPWSEAVDVTITAPPTGTNYWHVDAVNVSGRTVLMLQVSTAGGGNEGELYLAWSDDGCVTFIRADNPVIARENFSRAGAASWQTWLYRGSFAFINDGYETRLGIWYSGRSGAGAWRIGYTEATLRAGTVGDLLSSTSAPELRAIRTSALAGSGIVFDSFSRPDSTTALGVAPTGHLWSNRQNAIAISGGHAYSPGAANSQATVYAAANVRVGMQIAGCGEDTWLMLRYTGPTAYFRIGVTGTLAAKAAAWRVEKVNGTASTIAAGIAAAANDDWVEVEANGNDFSVYVNGRLVTAFSDAFNAAATMAGLQLASATAKVRSFYAAAVGTAPAISVLTPPAVSSSSAPPTASVDYRGVVWIQRGGAGVADTVQVCSKDAAGAYAWRTLI